MSDDQFRQLHQLDFIWDVSEATWTRKIFPALRLFKQKHGHLNVPRSFVVVNKANDEDGEDWPSHLHGINLGNVVHMIRSHKYFSSVKGAHEQLTRMGFDWGPTSDTYWHQVVLPSLETFHRVHGHCVVPSKFVVPSEDSMWPKEAWGLRLGIVAKSIRHNGTYKKQIERDHLRWNQLHFRMKGDL